MTQKRELAIDRGIPCPGPKGPTTPAGITARAMKSGDSVFVTDKSEFETLRRTIHELGGKYQTRRRDEEGVKGWRIWRVA